MSNTVKETKYLSFAKAVTFATTPAIIGAMILLYTLYIFSPSTEVFYKTFLSVALLSIVLPVLAIIYLVKKGHIGNFHMKDRDDRVLPFGLTLACGVISLLIIKHFQTNPMLIRMFLTFFLMALGYSVITFLKFKLSGHTFVFTSGILLLVFFHEPRFIYLLPLVLLIGWARTYLDEHTRKEVVGGFVYAIASFLVFSILISS